MNKKQNKTADSPLNLAIARELLLLHAAPKQAEAVVVGRLERKQSRSEVGLRVEVGLVGLGGTEHLLYDANVRAVADREINVGGPDHIAVPALAVSSHKHFWVDNANDDVFACHLDDPQRWVQRNVQVLLDKWVTVEHLEVNSMVADVDGLCFAERALILIRLRHNCVFLRSHKGGAHGLYHVFGLLQVKG